MNTVEDVVVLFVPAVTITCDGDLCTIVVACGTETVRKTVPLGLVVIVVVVLPFNRGLPIGCTSVTLMGVTLPGVPVVRFCMALWTPLLLLVSKLVPACITGAAVTAAAAAVVDVVVVMVLLIACECL